jgi:bacterioferritin-associated ferredoxin
VLDTEVIFAAIRIATYGNKMTVDHTCGKCETENTYDLDLNSIIEYFKQVQYDNKIVLKDLVIRTQPLTYKQSTRFNIKNFELQQKLGQAENMEGEAQQKIINTLFAELAEIQTDLYRSSIESVEIEGAVVTEREYINEWLINCDKEVYDAIKAQIDKNRDTWSAPKFNVKCGTCNTATKLFVELDQSNFFVAA